MTEDELALTLECARAAKARAVEARLQAQQARANANLMREECRHLTAESRSFVEFFSRRVGEDVSASHRRTSGSRP